MKKLAVAFLLFAGFLTSAQNTFSLGLKGGVNLQEINFKNFDGHQVYSEFQSGDRALGYHAGVWGRGILGSFVIQSELLFTHIISEAKASGSQVDDQRLNFSFNRFDMPFLLGLKFGPLMLGAGPVGSFNFETSNDVFNKSMDDFTWGYQAVAGIIIKKITIDFRYEGPFGPTARAIVIDGSTYATDIRINQFIIGLNIDML